MARSKPKPADRRLYAAVIADAKRRFAVWPSAYASGWVVQEYARRGGRYEPAAPAGSSAGSSTGLTKWFGEEWVDLSRPVYDAAGGLTGYEPCGRAASNPAAYPKCRPLAQAMAMTPEEVRSAIQRKRAAESRAAPPASTRSRAPIRVPTFRRSNPSRPPARVRCECGWEWDVLPDDPEPLTCHRCGRGG
jgi:hypothetical protein